jgi:hypothetical protein
MARDIVGSDWFPFAILASGIVALAAGARAGWRLYEEPRQKVRRAGVIDGLSAFGAFS